MKKAIYTFGLFSMMMLLTSFTTNTSTATSTSTAATTIEENHTDTGYLPPPGRIGKRDEFKDSKCEEKFNNIKIQESFKFISDIEFAKKPD